MITRPKISRNEWKTTEIGAFEVGNFATFSCPAGDLGLAGLVVEDEDVAGDLGAVGGDGQGDDVVADRRGDEHDRRADVGDLEGLAVVGVTHVEAVAEDLDVEGAEALDVGLAALRLNG